MTQLAIISTGLLTATALAGIGLAWWVARTDTGPVTADWDVGELAALPPPRWAALRGEPCDICQGRHCAGCDAPAQYMSAARHHLPRHDFAEVPPSLLWLAARVDVTFRGALIAGELAGRWTWRPVDGVAFRLWAGRKLGRPLQLGLVTPGRLP